MDRGPSSSAAREVRVRYAHIDDVFDDASKVERAIYWLTPAEQARHARYRLHADQRMFLLGRMMARTLVGQALGVDPLAWPWRENERGRPEIDDPMTAVCFNIAHSAGLVVCAVSSTGLVGVDVEHRRRRPIDERLIRRFCAPPEVADIEACAPALRQDAFLRYWTLKEAYLKARGLGIAVHLADVCFRLGDHIRVEFLDSLAGTSTGWAFHLSEAGTDHFIAVAAPVIGGEPRAFLVEPLAPDALFA